MRRIKAYIPSPQHWKEVVCNPRYEGMWTLLEKVPIERIRIDKSLFSYQNEIDHGAVIRMLANFDPELWLPITVNDDYYLLDGQHRLQVARLLCVEYIDVVMEFSNAQSKHPQRKQNCSTV